MNKARNCAEQRGFSLLEVLVALTIFAVSMLGVTRLVSGTSFLRVKAQNAMHRTILAGNYKHFLGARPMFVKDLDMEEDRYAEDIVSKTNLSQHVQNMSSGLVSLGVNFCTFQMEPHSQEHSEMMRSTLLAECSHED